MTPTAPDIVHTPGTCGGRARLAGHRIRVMDVVLLHEHGGLSPDEIVQHLPSLRLAEVHAALGYYFDHQAEIQADIQQDAQAAESLGGSAPSLFDEKRLAGRREAS